MTIEIDLPDGSVAEFPDGTPDDVIEKALQEAFPTEQAAAPKAGHANVPDFVPIDKSGQPLPGYNPKTGMMEKEPPSTVSDLAHSITAGGRNMVESFAGMAGDLPNLAMAGSGWLAKQLGEDPAVVDREVAQFRGDNPLPTSASVREKTEPYLGGEYEPQSVAGDYAKTGASFLPSLLSPGSAGRKVASWALPTVASETAGQVTKGTEYEPYARFAGALAGGVAGAGRSTREATAQAARGAPTGEALRNETNALYQQLRDAGIQYDQAAYVRLVRDAATDIRLGSRSLSPRTVETINEMADWARRGTTPDFNDVNDLSIMIGSAADDAASALARGDRTAGAELTALNRLRDRIEDFEANAPMTNTAGMATEEVNALRHQARQTALRNIKNRRLDRVLTDADTYAGGREAGIRQGLRTMLKSNRGRIFRGQERQALLDVANGRKPLLVLSKFGFDLRSVSGNAAFMPAMGAAAAGLGAGLPYGAALAGAGTAAKFLSPALTEAAFNRASGAVRGGGLANPGAAAALEALERQRRARIAFSAASSLPSMNSSLPQLGAPVQ